MRTGILSDQIRQLPTSLFIALSFEGLSSILVGEIWIGKKTALRNAQNPGDYRKISLEVGKWRKERRILENLSMFRSLEEVVNRRS